MDSALAAAAATAAVAAFPNFADVAGAVALLVLADSPPAPSPPPPPPTVSDELSCYSGSSASYSGTSARSCVSDSAQRGRPVDPLRVLAVVASLRRIDPKVLAKATNTLFQGESSKKRKGVWIHIDDDEDESERNSAVASEGSTVTGTASAGSTATSGRSHRPPRASGGGDQLPRRADKIMKWLSRPGAVPATETTIRAAVGDNAGTSKALRLLHEASGLLATFWLWWPQ
ncbi:hypothetical protein OsI_27164 [Oryza sativa Indica Group]|uniref:HTH three-helical bundle domain-containing protein n=1 Tax=Oryza sativa subsp. indica TaxID=39946 RepID=A2YPH2_ORYSI|nr:hypothetical protein OsI_27164 [Oryza sativa Indica Group]